MRMKIKNVFVCYYVYCWFDLCLRIKTRSRINIRPIIITKNEAENSIHKIGIFNASANDPMVPSRCKAKKVAITKIFSVNEPNIPINSMTIIMIEDVTVYMIDNLYNLN